MLKIHPHLQNSFPMKMDLDSSEIDFSVSFSSVLIYKGQNLVTTFQNFEIHKL